MAAVADVEGDDAVRPGDVITARFLVGAAAGDVEGLLAGRERQPVGLVETVRDDRQPARPEVVAVHVVPDLRFGPETLQVAVARVGEPDRAVAADHDVVRRVQPQPAPRVDDGLDLARRWVYAADPGVLGARALLADHQAPVTAKRHPVGHVDARRYDRQPRGIYREVETVQSEPFDVGTRGTRCGDIYFARQGGEIQHILAWDVDRSLVRVSLGHQREARGGP